MYDVAEPFQLHQMVDLDSLGLADAIDIVSSQVYKHDMLRAIFLGC